MQLEQIILLFFLIIIAIYGIILIFFKDFAWKIQKWSNDLAGRESKRTKSWEIGSTLTGILFTLLGSLPLVYSLIALFISK